MLFSFPTTFDAVSTMELRILCSLLQEFAKRNMKCIALSCEPVESYKEWMKDIQPEISNIQSIGFPKISDPGRQLVDSLDILDSALVDHITHWKDLLPGRSVSPLTVM